MNNRIKTFREMKGISQVTLAEVLRISQKKISNIENGLVEPSLSEINKLTQVLNCKFEELFINEEEEGKMYSNVLIQYTKMECGHVDPNYTQLIYGDSRKRGARLKNIKLGKGSHAFFHTSIGGAEYITGYFEIEKILYKDTDGEEISNLKVDASEDEIVIIGNRDNSKILTLPLPLDINLAVELTSLGISHKDYEVSTQSKLAFISSKTREHRKLSQFDTDLLIKKCDGRG